MRARKKKAGGTVNVRKVLAILPTPLCPNVIYLVPVVSFERFNLLTCAGVSTIARRIQYLTLSGSGCVPVIELTKRKP